MIDNTKALLEVISSLNRERLHAKPLRHDHILIMWTLSCLYYISKTSEGASAILRHDDGVRDVLALLVSPRQYTNDVVLLLVLSIVYNLIIINYKNLTTLKYKGLYDIVVQLHDDGDVDDSVLMELHEDELHDLQYVIELPSLPSLFSNEFQLKHAISALRQYIVNECK